MKSRLMTVLAAIMIAVMVGCSAHVHTIGDGAQGNKVIKKKQWYVVFGLVPINEIDTAEMAGDAEDYQIETVQKFDDVLISLVLGNLSIGSRTVIVTK